MLTGAAGVGKEVAARFIHYSSPRSNGPFISVNSASIAPDMMEEVLFGKETEDRGHEPGLFERAHGGVLFFEGGRLKMNIENFRRLMTLMAPDRNPETGEKNN